MGAEGSFVQWIVGAGIGGMETKLKGKEEEDS